MRRDISDLRIKTKPKKQNLTQKVRRERTERSECNIKKKKETERSDLDHANRLHDTSGEHPRSPTVDEGLHGAPNPRLVLRLPLRQEKRRTPAAKWGRKEGKETRNDRANSWFAVGR